MIYRSYVWISKWTLSILPGLDIASTGWVKIYQNKEYPEVAKEVFLELDILKEGLNI